MKRNKLYLANSFGHLSSYHRLYFSVCHTTTLNSLKICENAVSNEFSQNSLLNLIPISVCVLYLVCMPSCKYLAILAPSNLHSFLVALSRKEEHVGKRRRAESKLMTHGRDFLKLLVDRLNKKYLIDDVVYKEKES